MTKQKIELFNIKTKVTLATIIVAIYLTIFGHEIGYLSALFVALGALLIIFFPILVVEKIFADTKNLLIQSLTALPLLLFSMMQITILIDSIITLSRMQFIVVLILPPTISFIYLVKKQTQILLLDMK
jgi:hypothetical protein